MPLRPLPAAQRHSRERVRGMTDTFITHPTVPRRLSAHLFELAVAGAWVIVAVAYILDPTRTLVMSPVGRGLPTYLWLSWSLLEAVGGSVVIGAILAARTDYRIAGLTLLAAGLTMHGLAAVLAGFDIRDLVYLLYAATCALRAVHITRLALGTK